MTASKLVLNAASGVATGDTTDVDDVFSTFLYSGNSHIEVVDNGIALGNSGDGGSVDFNASSISRINLPSHADFGFGTGDWTIEFFVFIKENYNYTELIDFRTSSQDAGSNVPIIYSDSSGTLYYFTDNSNRITSNSGALSEGVFHHIAVARSGSTTKMFIDGTQAGSNYTDGINYETPASSWSIGGSLEQNQYNLRGHMSNVRIVKGTALYTSNFTAPTSELTAVTNTKLLTLQGDTPFVDNSGNSHTITKNGTPVASPFGPFTGTTGEGGLVWIKRTDGTLDHALFDTERGVGKYLSSSTANNEYGTNTPGDDLTAFNGHGFTLGDGQFTSINYSSYLYVAWTFRKAPKFFDIVTYDGSSSAQSIAHNLGVVPAMIMVKQLNASGRWTVYHKDASPTGNPQNGRVALNTSDPYNEYPTISSFATLWNQTAPTSTHFTVGTNATTGENGSKYVAYLFANNNNDGEFGPNGDQDIIKVGSYTGNGSSTGPVVNLGFEPQWLMIKRTSGSEDWMMFDAMRGVVTAGVGNDLRANSSSGQNSSINFIDFNSTGFQPAVDYAHVNDNADNYIYMAIRRGPLAEPTDATKVFTVLKGQQANTAYVPGFTANHVVDFALSSQTSSSSNVTGTRLLGDTFLSTDSTAVETSNNVTRTNGYQNGFFFTNGGADAARVAWMWKRAPGYFDVVAYKGNGSSGTSRSHNLKAVPEMMWIKGRDYADHWGVYHKDIGASNRLQLNSNVASGSVNYFGTTPTDSLFYTTADNATNQSGINYVAYLFATLAGVSKVGSFTLGSSGSSNIDCGFSSGARFILAKKTSGTGGWLVWDTARGIVAGNDSYLLLNDTTAETGGYDFVDPYSQGFTIPDAANWGAGDYIFYAIA